MTKCDQKTSGDNFFFNFMRIREGLGGHILQEGGWVGGLTSIFIEYISAKILFDKTSVKYIHRVVHIYFILSSKHILCFQNIFRELE